MHSPLAFAENRHDLLQEYGTCRNTVGQRQNIGFLMHLFDWKHNASKGTDYEVKSVDELKKLAAVAVRVVFAPRDIRHPACIKQLTDMFNCCNIPSGFISESLQQVSQSFGTRVVDDDTTDLWFHFLSKDIHIQKKDGQWRVVHPGAESCSTDQSDGRVENDHATIDEQAQRQSQANFQWIKTGVVLRVKEPNGSSPTPSGSATSGGGSMTNSPEVTLYCFGAPITFLKRFKALSERASCDDLLRDPYILVMIVFEEMYQLLDATGWWVARSFGSVETRTLHYAEDNLVNAGKKPDFTGLHNLAKHTIYLQENCESALATLEGFGAFHVTTLGPNPNSSQRAMKQAIDYRKTLFESTKRRLSSLDKRIMNIIQLFFNLVTLADSRTMQSENKSMKTIAIMMLFFTPLSTVAAVFGTEFFHLTDNAPFRFQVSQDIWMLAVTAGPLTIVVVMLWLFWDWKAREKLIGKVPGFGGRDLYNGMKHLRGLSGGKRGAQNDEGIPLTNMPARHG